MTEKIFDLAMVIIFAFITIVPLSVMLYEQLKPLPFEKSKNKKQGLGH